ncbi:UDP-glucuronosyltransferase 1A6-like [Convolutriloba macropyga]|uniref:UDP-glucuronosyltransferase 1A6-like n=1 Tax=Convolutriloba macropyga TaxID=536237 RepID=UPI003F52813C
MKVFEGKFDYQVIVAHGLRDNIDLEGELDFLFQYCPRVMEFHLFLYDLMMKFLAENEGNYDIMITDQYFSGALVAAEYFNIPVIAQTPGAPAGVEHFQEKWFMSPLDSIILRLVFKPCVDWTIEKRAELGLPSLDDQGGFLSCEYSSRLPFIIPTSPSIYPKPHERAEYIYIGAFRNASQHQKINKKLEEWMLSDDRDIVYISLGTMSVVDKATFKKMVDHFYNLNDYKVIWATSSGLQNIAQELGVFEFFHENFYIGGYQPQFSILGHERVKMFVTHAGLGSMVDLIKQNVPAIFAPQYFDQFQNSKQMAIMKLGVNIGQFDFESLDRSVKSIRKNYEEFKSNLARVSAEFAYHENPELIRNFVEKVAGRKKTTIQYHLPYQLSSSRHHYAWKIFVFMLTAIALSFVALVLKCAAKICRKSEKAKVN